MAAVEVQQIGADIVLTVGGSAVAGRRGGTLDIQTVGIPIDSVDSDMWDDFLAGVRSWTVPLDGLFLEGANEVTGEALVVSFGASGGALTEVGAVRQVTINMAAQFDNIVNPSSAFDRKVLPVSRNFGLNVNLDYLDIEGTAGAGHEILFDAQVAGTALDFTVAFGSSLSFSGSCLVSGLPLSSPHRQAARVNGFTIHPKGALALSGTAGAGISSMITAFLASPPTTVTVVAAPTTVASANWSGSAYVQDMSVTIPREDAATVTGTLLGNGALTPGTVSA